MLVEIPQDIKIALKKAAQLRVERKALEKEEKKYKNKVKEFMKKNGREKIQLVNGYYAVLVNRPRNHWNEDRLSMDLGVDLDYLRNYYRFEKDVYYFTAHVPD
jgi:hypothetical protein